MRRPCCGLSGGWQSEGRPRRLGMEKWGTGGKVSSSTSKVPQNEVCFINVKVDSNYIKDGHKYDDNFHLLYLKNKVVGIFLITFLL